MFPIRDHNPSQKFPFVTVTLMGLNIAIFLTYAFSGPGFTNAIFFGWAMIPARISSGDGYFTLVSSMFLHGGWMHLIGNMLLLWIFGDNLEEAFGHLGFLLFYLGTGLVAGFAHYYSDMASGVPTVGASGAIAGVLGGYLLLYPKAKVDVLLILVIFFRVFTVPAWVMLGIWFGLQLFNGVSTDISGGGVAYWAHAGGFVTGFIVALPYWLSKGARGFWHRTEGHPPHPDTQYSFTKSSIPKVPRK